MTIETAAQRLVAKFNAKIPLGVNGVQSVWIRTDVVDGQFAKRIAVALNVDGAGPIGRIARELAGLVGDTVEDYQVDHVPWPTGPHHDVIAAYEDGSVPKPPEVEPAVTPEPVEVAPEPELAPRRPARAEPLAAKPVTKVGGKPIVKRPAAKRVVYPAKKPPRRK